ncbi:ribitol 5-phosphate transferase FKRP [Cinclus cinclus]|uniref:ribitol 5-phosphate transferase FKRP n=1 Tax=Cinclus cinclus TaxID=127875 RepID=UPI002E0E06CA
MRITPCQAALAAAIALNLLLLLCSRSAPGASPRCRRPGGVPGVTVILRDFDGPDHDVAATARSFSSLPGVPVLVVAEASPYPPVPLPAGVAVLSLRPEPHRAPPRPELAVRTRHVALVPDGARAAPGLLRRMRDALEADGDAKVVAAAVGRRRPRCLRLEVDVKKWTVRYGHGERESDWWRSDQNDQRNDQRGNEQNNQRNDRWDDQNDQWRDDQNDQWRDDQNDQWRDDQNDQWREDQNDQWREDQNDQWRDDQNDHNDQWTDDQWRDDQWRDDQNAQRNDRTSDRRRGDHCGALDGAPAVLLLRTRDLFSLPFPLTRPVVTSLSLQASVRGWRLLLLPDAFPASRRPPPSPHEERRARASLDRHRRTLLEQLGIKLEVLPDGRRRWHGCAKDTPRCFGTVRAQTPQYLLQGRWTPPCCLRALRATARHVLARLEEAGVRHWLEGGSLLGAVRLGDIIPWDYDVDVGIYREDVPKCRWLAAVAAAGRPVEDPEGFLWEKAAEGEFFRVHFSRTNRLHVDLWPFYARPGGVMTKDSWLGHPQDVEFPERFLVPLGTVAFVGVRARAPNDPRRFLEFKFGPGVVENPEYPNPQVRRLAQDVGNKNAR